MGLIVNPYRYATGAVTDPNFSNVKLLMGFEGTNGSTAFVDESASPHTMTAAGSATISTAQSKFGTSSLRLTGSTSDFVSAADSNDWWIGNNGGSAAQFTVEFFVRFNTAPSATTLGMIGQASTTAGTSSWYLAWHATPAGPRFAGFNSTTQTSVEVAQAFVTGQWYHWAVTRDGSNAVRLFIDGTMVVKQTYVNTMNNSTELLRIGHALSNSNSFDGWMDELRITTNVCRYGSDGGFTVPTAAFPRS